MSYIGQQLPADVFSGFTIDKFTGDGTANKALTLSKAPFSETTVLVTIDGVVQEPTDDFTVSGTTLTLVGTAANGSEINVTHLSGTVPSTLASKVDVNGVSDAIILDADADTTISADTDDQIDFKAGGTDIMSLTATTATFNDGVTITTADNSDTLTLISTDDDANAGPKIEFKRTSSSPADNDIIGQFTFSAENDAGQSTDYCRFRVHLDDVTDGEEDGNFRLFTLVAGSEVSRIDIDKDETVFNEDSVDVDFRVESNGDANCLRVKGDTDRVGIGTNSPSYKLSVHQDEDNIAAGNFKHTGDNSSSNPQGIRIEFSGSSPDDTGSLFISAADSTSSRFLVTANGNVTNHDNSYGQISDERIKQNITDANSQWDDIKALKVKNFERKDDVAVHGEGKKVQIGLIAQECEAVSPGLVNESEPMAEDIKMSSEFGTLNEDGTIKTTTGEKVKSISYSVLYMKAIKALQEAMAKIETLETKVKALENA